LTAKRGALVTRRFILPAVLLVALVTTPVPVSADPIVQQPMSVSTSMRYQVTFAARTCTMYSQVMANRVRDDTAESPVSPGRDNTYDDGAGVDPDVEASQANGCEPLNGWRFTLGGGHEKNGPLSSVTGPLTDVGPTASDTPLLDPLGKPTQKVLAGSITVTLTADQVSLAIGGQLWAQGGAPDDPLLSGSMPEYGFGALRCAYDGRSDTNAQRVGFPAGVRHVFCFAYYVRSAAPTGTLVVRAKPTRAVGYPQRFEFDASPSYAANKKVELVSAGDPDDVSLTRTSGGTPSTIVGHAPDGWRLTDLGCSKSGSGDSLIVADAATATANVTLAPGEIVVCTYTFDPPVVATGLSVKVFSDLAAGSFGVTVSSAAGATALQAEPKGDGSAAAATGADVSSLSLATPGRYTLTVAPPQGQSGVWTLGGINCDGVELRASGLTATVNVPMDGSLDCVLRMKRRAASIDLSTVTVGGTGSAPYVIMPVAGGGSWTAGATTTGFGVPAPATGDLPEALDFGTYLIMPYAPESTVNGSWKLSSFVCDPGDPAPAASAGGNLVKLTPGDPTAKCVATFNFDESTKLRVNLRFDGDTTAHQQTVALDVSCADGSTGRVVGPAQDDSQQTLPTPLGFLDPTRCTFERPPDGAPPTVSATVSAALDPAPGNAPLSLPATVEIKRDVAEYTVTVTITYSSLAKAPQESTVLNSFRILPMALIGAGLAGLGLVILLVMVVRSRGV
jgi:hypothetical protein